MLYAKRHYEDGKLIEETLEQHIRYCLEVYENIIKLFPVNPVDFPDDSITWEEIVFILVTFHDMGKAAYGFQNITLDPNTTESWKFRHEVLSAEFIDLIEIDEKIKTAIKIAILGHHEKSIKELKKLSFSEEYSNMIDVLSEVMKDMSNTRKDIYINAKESIRRMWGECVVILKWIEHEYEKRFVKRIKISFDFDSLHPICNQIDDYYYAIESMSERYDYSLILLLKGMLITCDHLGSAHENIYSIDMDILKYYHDKFNIGVDGNDFRATQKKSNTEKDSLLIAPTGTGKTEAALIWVNNHIKKNSFTRVFYVLPYTASINAMYERLQEESFSNGKIDMKHGKALYSYYHELVESKGTYEDLKEIQKRARLLKQTSKEISKPIKIVTPHQIIKAFNKVKGFETLITEFYNAAFILDEIHCYDDELLCILILCLKYIKDKLIGKLFLMSATLPKVLSEIILNELNISSKVITMPKKELQKFRKHRLHIIERTIENNIGRIIYDLEHCKRVLVVCNTVKKAQYINEKIKQYARTNILLHSYFTVLDRNNLENMLIKCEKKRENNVPIQLLVGTQAIEVSLDLDFDTIYTELAPIDALIQRFGRVFRNRKRSKGEYGDVYVCCEYDRGSDYIYNKGLRLLDRTLEYLQEYDGMVLTDEIIQIVLNQVYGEEYKKILFETLEEQKKRFENITFFPLQDYSEEAQSYYDQFDGIKICPEVYFEKYKELILDGLYIEAEGYLMTIPEKRIAQYLSKNMIEKQKVKNNNCIYVACKVHFDYDSINGLQEKNIGIGEGILC